jgi:hypothetical protein
MSICDVKQALDLHKKWLLHEAGGQQLCLPNADLRGVDLTNADLRCANLRYTNLQGANLQNVNLQCADLTGANLRAANLSDADLRNARFCKANLINAKLLRTNLMFTDFTDADMRGTDLRLLISTQFIKGVDLQVINMPKEPIVRHGTQVAMFAEHFRDIDYWIANYRKFGKFFGYSTEELKLYRLALNFIEKSLAVKAAASRDDEIETV